MESLEDLESLAAELVRASLEEQAPDAGRWAERNAGLVRQAFSAGVLDAAARRADGHDLAAFARAVQWALRVADAALPLSDMLSAPLTSAEQADRMAMRLAAFRVALDEVRKHGPAGSPGDLEALRAGIVPGPPAG